MLEIQHIHAQQHNELIPEKELQTKQNTQVVPTGSYILKYITDDCLISLRVDVVITLKSFPLEEKKNLFQLPYRLKGVTTLHSNTIHVIW